MSRWRISSLFLMGMLPLILGIAACSDDDDGNGNPPGDTTAPIVSEIEPGDGWTNVSLNEAVVVEFSEAMDQNTADGNISLSQGTITGFTWTSDNVVSVAHTGWTEATQVTVTVGTGLTDLAGNNLPQAWTATFWTESSSVVFLESDPASGATGVNRSVQPRLHFSHTMNLASLAAATIITDDGKGAAVVPTWEMASDGDSWYRIVFSEDLDAATSYTIEVSTNAQAEGGAGNLSAPVSISFTTGTEVDTTPPEIVSSSPSGSGINPNLVTITITFSEPIDTRADLRPDRINGQLMTSLAGEPDWNPSNTVLTVYVVPPLASGVRYFAVFGPGTFQDMNGNWNTVADSVSFTVSGSPDYFPITRDWVYEYARFGVEFPQFITWLDSTRVTFENISGDTFDQVWWKQNPVGGTWEVDHRQFMRKNSTGLFFRGFTEGGGNIMFTPEVLYQDFPMTVTDWSGSSTGTQGLNVFIVDYEGETTGPETLVFEDGMDEPNIVFEKCYRSILNHSLTLEGAMEPFEDGADTVYYAPGIGMVQQFSGGRDYEEETSFWERMYLMEIFRQ